MSNARRDRFGRLALAAAMLLTGVYSSTLRAEEPPGKEVEYWNVDDVQAGMTGYGVTVMKGTQTERFLVEVIGVLKSFSPGRDMILVRVAGIGLEKTGVISGMSGSPVYVQDKLLGAIAFTWPFGKEPIGGITPFSQMVEFAKPTVKNAEWVTAANSSYLLDRPFDNSAIQQAAGNLEGPEWTSASADHGRLVRIQTPLSTTGLSDSALAELGRQLGPMGFLPVQGGGVNDRTLAKNLNAKIEPGGAMAVGLVTGDVSMSAIGTVTAVSANRVYGFGHPFFGSGTVELPLSTAYIHTVIPRQTVSSKMGSALSIAGKVDADVSTCVAGWLGQNADMVPVSIRIKNQKSTLDKTFQCEVVRDRLLLAPLTMTVLGSYADMEGQAPNDLTAKLTTTVELEGQEPLVMTDVYSGPQYSGGRGLMRVFTPIANLLGVLGNNPYHRPRIKSVTCVTEIADRDQSARITHARVVHPILEPGEKLQVAVKVQPMSRPGWSDATQPDEEDITVALDLPKNLPPGNYSATIGSANDDFRIELAGKRHLTNPTDFAQLYKFIKMQLALRRTDLVLRYNVPTKGVVVDGTELPSLPAAAFDILNEDLGGKVTTLQDSIVTRKETNWVIEGFQPVQFEVVKEKSFYE